MPLSPADTLSSVNFARGAGHRPLSACVIFHVRNVDSAACIDSLAARIVNALAGAAPAVVVLCAAGEPIMRARAHLRVLHEALQPTAIGLAARVSRSATAGLAAWAASTAGPVGIDVQSHVSSLDSNLLDLALHPAEACWLAGQLHPEAAFTRLWAAKEATLKAFGVGLSWSPREVEVLPSTDIWRTLSIPALGSAWLSSPGLPVTFRGALSVAINAGHAPVSV